MVCLLNRKTMSLIISNIMSLPKWLMYVIWYCGFTNLLSIVQLKRRSSTPNTQHSLKTSCLSLLSIKWTMYNNNRQNTIVLQKLPIWLYTVVEMLCNIFSTYAICMYAQWRIPISYFCLVSNKYTSLGYANKPKLEQK